MKKIFVLFALVCATAAVNAQQYILKSFTLSNGLTIQPGQWVDGSLIGATSGKPYLYRGYEGDQPAFDVNCVNCTEQNQAGGSSEMKVDVEVDAVDEQYNYDFLQETKRHNKATEDNAYYGLQETHRHNTVDEQQGKTANVINGLGMVLNEGAQAANLVALYKGKYQSNVNTNVFTTTNPTPPNTNNGPWTGPSTTVPIVNNSTPLTGGTIAESSDIWKGIQVNTTSTNNGGGPNMGQTYTINNNGCPPGKTKLADGSCW